MAEDANVERAAERMAKLNKMRDKRDGVTPATEVVVKGAEGEKEAEKPASEAVAVKAESEKLMEAALKETPAAEVQEAKPAVETQPPNDASKSQTEEVEIDGQKVSLDPALADAFKKADKVLKQQAKDLERRALKEEVLAEIRAEQPPEKSAAELAADKALADAEKEAADLKPPDGTLSISDPDKFAKEFAEYTDKKVALELKKAKQEFEKERATERATNQRVAEDRARAQITEEFFAAYPQLASTRDITTPLLHKRLDEIVASGRLNKPLTAEERETMQTEEFAGVAATATRKIVGLMQVAKQVVAAPKTAPVLAHSAQRKEAQPEPEVKKKKEKFPEGSLSAALKARQQKLSQPAA